MKIHFLSLILLMACSTSQKRELASVKAEFNHQQELVYIVDGEEKKDPPIHPDLLAEQSIDLEEQIHEINTKLQILESKEGINSGLSVGVPDYKIVYHNLQKKMSDSLLGFVKTIDSLNLKLKKDLSRLASVQRTYQQYPDDIWKQAYYDEVAKLYPNMQSYLKTQFQDAIKNLYTLDGKLDLFVRADYKKGFGLKRKTNIFKTTNKKRKRWHNNIGIKYGEGCITSMCYQLITRDIANWIQFVSKINKTYKLSESRKVQGSSNRAYRLPITSIAIKDFVKRLIKVGLKKNKEYTSGSALTEYIKNLGTSSAGIATAIITSPIHLLGRVGSFLSRLGKTDKFIITELHLPRLETYKTRDAIEDFKTARAKFNNKFRGVAVGEEEYSSVFKKAQKEILNEKPKTEEFFLKQVLPKDKELYTVFTQNTSYFFAKQKLDHSTFTELIAQYDLSTLKKFQLKDIQKYGTELLKQYTPYQLSQYKIEDINKYGMGNILRHGLDSLKKHDLKDLNAYGARALEQYGLKKIKQYGLKNIKKYGIKSIEKHGLSILQKGYSQQALDRFSVKDLEKYGENNLNRYGLEKLQKYGKKALQTYTFEDLKNYPLSEIKKYEVKDVQSYGMKSIKKFGIKNIKKYGVYELENYGLHNIKKYGLKELKTYPMDDFKKYGMSKLKRAKAKYGEKNLLKYGYKKLVNGTSFKCQYTTDKYYKCRDYRYSFWVLRPFKSLKAKCIEESIKHAKNKRNTFDEFCGVIDIK